MARGDFPSSKQEQFVLRFPEGMRDRIRAAADENSRSMNAEIIARLDASLDPHANKDEQIAWLHDYLEDQSRERVRLYEALNNQDRILQSLNNAHRTIAILAKSVGEAFLSTGEKTDVLAVLAAGLADVDVDLSSDPSEEIPKQPWED
jgi:hypothetical protein